jgi:hypothetical protein
MDEQTCPRCGAKSAAGAAYCWQCFARFADPAPAESQVGPTATAGPLAAALGRGPGAGTPAAVISEPATVTRWQPQQKAGRDAALGWVVRGLVFVVAAVGGYFGYQWLFGGFPFPDEVGGYERVESDDVEGAAEAVASIAEILEVEMEIALYGSEIQPAYVMFVFEVPEEGALAGVQPFGGPASGEIGFQCGPDAQGAGCVWEQEGQLVGLGAIGQTVEQLEPVARQVKAELDA